MRDFKGKIVFVTGGASGAGLGQAKVFGREGMKVCIADIRQDALDNAVKELIAFGIPEKDILAQKVDLTNRSSRPRASTPSAPSKPPPSTTLTGSWASA